MKKRPFPLLIVFLLIFVSLFEIGMQILMRLSTTPSGLTATVVAIALPLYVSAIITKSLQRWYNTKNNIQ
jgi:hypothetical protein